MRISKLFLAALVPLCLTASGHAAGLGADDFLPPAQANTPEAKQEAEQIREPAAVKQEKGIDGQPATAAANAQDAVNAAIKNMLAGDGCEQIKFPSGFGWVAAGTAIYGVKPNPVATLHDQRWPTRKPT